MSDKQYGHYEQGVDSEFFSVHMNQMTAEKLCSKSDIAAELAYRDQRIAELEAKVQELEAAQRWIPVSEGLPDEPKGKELTQVLAFHPEYGVRTMGYTPDLLPDSNSALGDRLTHWMPLPTPPEVEHAELLEQGE